MAMAAAGAGAGAAAPAAPHYHMTVNNSAQEEALKLSGIVSALITNLPIQNLCMMIHSYAAGDKLAETNQKLAAKTTQVRRFPRAVHQMTPTGEALVLLWQRVSVQSHRVVLISLDQHVEDSVLECENMSQAFNSPTQPVGVTCKGDLFFFSYTSESNSHCEIGRRQGARIVGLGSNASLKTTVNEGPLDGMHFARHHRFSPSFDYRCDRFVTNCLDKSFQMLGAVSVDESGRLTLEHCARGRVDNLNLAGENIHPFSSCMQFVKWIAPNCIVGVSETHQGNPQQPHTVVWQSVYDEHRIVSTAQSVENARHLGSCVNATHLFVASRSNAWGTTHCSIHIYNLGNLAERYLISCEGMCHSISATDDRLAVLTGPQDFQPPIVRLFDLGTRHEVANFWAPWSTSRIFIGRTSMLLWRSCYQNEVEEIMDHVRIAPLERHDV